MFFNQIPRNRFLDIIVRINLIPNIEYKVLVNIIKVAIQHRTINQIIVILIS